jgi:signal transduction histidine kinase/HPt (histidine-containing phosphotransfer) domain-containing protein
MSGMVKTGVIRATKGKVILALTLACFALFMAWAVSRVAFKEMLDTVENITSPNERLRIVNELSRNIARLDQSQKNLVFNESRKYNSFFKESRQLRKDLDTLGMLYSADTVQLRRIASIKELLRVRDKQFVDYLKVRERLVNDRSFSQQLKSFNNMVDKTAAAADSTVVTSERRTTTTTVIPSDEKPRSLLSKIFGSGKKKSEEDIASSIRVTNEENVTRDTIALSTDGKIVEGVEKSLRAMQRAQQQKSRVFVAREAVLAKANNVLTIQMLDILKKVEHEAVLEIEQSSIQAKKVVNTGIKQMTIIMVVFFLLMVLLLFLILTDITRSNRYRKELEEATEQAEYHGKAKQRFLANMSHEIRTPLQSIIGYAEIIRTQDHPDPAAIDAIYDSSEHLLQIVNEILDYNRLISGKFTFTEQVFNIRQLLEEVVKIVAPQAERKSLRLKTTFELDHVNYLQGDPFRLKQILFNLLSNAIKFTMQGEVELCAFFKRQGDNLHFTFRVKDTGIGLTEEESTQIFNEFEQADAPEQTEVNQNGAGLGLTIVKALVENQGGRIYVKSKKGQGSNFSFFLTFKVAETPALVVGETRAALSGQQHKVWVVDDDQLILDLCSLIFKKHGINYTCFQSPQDMLEAPVDPAVRFVLMDIRMPKMSGMELCKIMRQKVAGDVKIFAMTAQVMPEEKEHVLASGFDGIVGKPFREQELLEIFEGANVIGDDGPVEETTGLVEPVEVPSQPEEPVLFDPAYLEKMTFGDQEQFDRILNRFNLDCQNDQQELLENLDKGNYDHVSLLLHRLAGRLSQMGSRDLAMSFRMMEIEVDASLAAAEEDELDEMQKERIVALCSQLQRLTYSIS